MTNRSDGQGRTMPDTEVQARRARREARRGLNWLRDEEASASGEGAVVRTDQRRGFPDVLVIRGTLSTNQHIGLAHRLDSRKDPKRWRCFTQRSGWSRSTG